MGRRTLLISTEAVADRKQRLSGPADPLSPLTDGGGVMVVDRHDDRDESPAEN